MSRRNPGIRCTGVFTGARHSTPLASTARAKASRSGLPLPGTRTTYCWYVCPWPRSVSPALFDLVVGRFGLRLLQHQKTVPLYNVPQPRDVSGPTETVYGDDGRCPRADDSVDGAGVEAVCRRIYVGEHRHGTCQAYGLGDLDVPERRHDDLVTCTDTRGPEHSCSPHAADGGRAT